jgi:alkanesulfonate monooxygenase SsuD/methylene tetrahydromethanopterin reductase-like flavin-dependent oxidoreductase (luciferase family)
VADASGDLELATTVALPVVRGPVLLAKALASLDVLSGGRVVAGVGPGSSPYDHEAVGLDFQERWRRLDDSVAMMRALWSGKPYDGRFYATAGVDVTPRPVQTGGPPLWIGSWGSEVGLRRVARLADGWLASAYHLTPETFADGRTRLGEELTSLGRPMLPNAVATFFLQVTDDRHEAEHLVTRVLAPALNRDPDVLAARLGVGPLGLVAERVDALRAAGVERLYVWPLHDHERQLELAQQALAA